MRNVIWIGVAVLFASVASACGDDDGGTDGGMVADGGGGTDGGGGATDGGGGGGSDGGGGDPDGGPMGTECERGCALVVAAGCANGPDNMAVCVSDCEMLRTGACGVEYEAFLTCADGEAISCDAEGRPNVAACMTEQATFVACLSM
jgi:hypothetical protein